MNPEINKSPKEQLADFVEHIFKGYTSSGLHICDIATGGGKSYTIGKLTCEYYPKYFDRIIILCVQNKLINAMNKDVDKFIEDEKSLISPEDKTVIYNNTELLKEAIDNNAFNELLDQMDIAIAEQKDRRTNVYKLRGCLTKLSKTYHGIESLIKIYGQKNNEFIQGQIDDGETNIRRQVRNYFWIYKQHVIDNGQYKDLTEKQIMNKFPALEKVYPQVAFRYKKVVIMTVHKAMYGIDPILADKFQLPNFPKGKDKKTLILFDESDQEAIAMRNVIIDRAIDSSGGSKRFARGYNGFLQYKDLIQSPERVTNNYYEGKLERAISSANNIADKNWKRLFGDIDTFNSIFLDKNEKLDSYRRGVFFCGPAMKMDVSQIQEIKSYICYKKGRRSLTLAHSKDEGQLKLFFDKVVPLGKFLSFILNSTTAIKSQLSKVVRDKNEKNKEEFKKVEKEIAGNNANDSYFLSYPTLEREIHTLFSRFETSSEYQFEQQLNEFITNRKNMILKVGGESKKLPDYSVYTQGVQLFLEEIDELDNLHRVRLSSREISTTPEKIITDLVTNDNITVVLCSATASSRSVISNIDISYLKLTLGDKVKELPEEDRKTFDFLVAQTYPKEHKVKVIPIEQNVYPVKLENRMGLPSRYLEMFSKEAIDEGLPETWFGLTKQDILHRQPDSVKDKLGDLSFKLNRYFQFIEVYHSFINHPDIHSMIYFQNQRGDRNKVQIMVLSSLIDGSYKKFSKFNDEIPKDWENEHIKITNRWDDMENEILSKLGEDKDARLMLVAAYGSFKAGANMQYDIPKGLPVVSGDNWETDGQTLKKDWDAIYLQTPTGYLTITDDENSESMYEKGLYNAMLSLMMLFERGCLTFGEVRLWLNKALAGKHFFFNDSDSPGVTKDKAAWAQTIIEQAVGRLCRTRNKPATTYIYYDSDISKHFYKENMEKSLTKEFRALADAILSRKDKEEQFTSDSDEVIRCNNANEAKRRLDMIRRSALRYTPHKGDWEDFDTEAQEGNILRKVIESQEMIKSFKHTIIRKPVIDDFDELTEEDKQLTFIGMCYGDWNRDETNGYTFHYEGTKNHAYRICTCNKGKAYPQPITSATVRLDTLVKNPVIRKYFEKEGIATSWKKGKYILHPEILSTDYCGEIGEEAFRALVLHYTNIKAEEFVHLSGINYELADFVILNSDGSYRIAFDVKNMNPNLDHDDRPNDMPTAEKREAKRERLKCELITVNLLQIKKGSFDDIHEIKGLIDSDGNIIAENMNTLISLVNNG